MKQSIKILLFLLSLNFLSQKAVGSIDTLVVTKQSRINYCNAKIAQVAILNERILLKDQAIVVLNNRIDKKQEEIASYVTSLELSNQQVNIAKADNKIVTEQNLALVTETKQLRKKVGILKIGFVAVTGLFIWSALKE